MGCAGCDGMGNDMLEIEKRVGGLHAGGKQGVTVLLGMNRRWT